MDILLSKVQILDLFLRFATVGQLSLFMVYLKSQHQRLPIPQITLIISIIAYVLLTAPIEDRHYSGLRNVLLLFTDIMPFAALWYTKILLQPNFKLSALANWLKGLFSVWLIVLTYVFLVMAGKSILHDINHGIGLIFLAYIVYLCLAEYIDDLDNKRRNIRLLIVMLCALYMTGLVSFEFVYRSVRDTWQFSLFNALMMFIAVFVLCSRLILHKKKTETKPSTPQVNNKHEHFDALTEFMEQGGYLQSELTINNLAEQINIPAHQLRQFINQELNFRNFSHYLNSYRIPWVCQQLQDKTQKKRPLLTLALEAGYGSIAPFNRAFKEQLGKTPTEYRDQF